MKIKGSKTTNKLLVDFVIDFYKKYFDILKYLDFVSVQVGFSITGSSTTGFPVTGKSGTYKKTN